MKSSTPTLGILEEVGEFCGIDWEYCRAVERAFEEFLNPSNMFLFEKAEFEDSRKLYPYPWQKSLR